MCTLSDEVFLCNPGSETTVQRALTSEIATSSCIDILSLTLPRVKWHRSEPYAVGRRLDSSQPALRAWLLKAAQLLQCIASAVSPFSSQALAAAPLWSVLHIAAKLNLVSLQLVVLVQQLQEVAVPAPHSPVTTVIGAYLAWLQSVQTA